MVWHSSREPRTGQPGHFSILYAVVCLLSDFWLERKMFPLAERALFQLNKSVFKFHSHPHYSVEHHHNGTCEKEKYPLSNAMALSA